MKKTVLFGTGEAFDEHNPNTSILIGGKTNLLLDCGYSIPPQIWKYNPSASFLDVIYISHTHADHYFGLPALLQRMVEEQRTKPLTVVSQKQNIPTIKLLIPMGFQHIMQKKQFPIRFLEAKAGKILKVNELELSFAPTTHSLPVLSICIQSEGQKICYSGDGQSTPQSEKLYKNSDLLIHEGWQFDEKSPNHTNIVDVIEMAEKAHTKKLAIVHVKRQVRKNLGKIKKQFSDKSVKVWFPEPGNSMSST